MTNGTSQGLFVVVAIVIFGIFVALSYTVFGNDGLSGGMVNLFEDALNIEPLDEKHIVELADYRYELNETRNTATIVKYLGSDVNIVIPSEVEYESETYVVNHIGLESFYNGGNMSREPINNVIDSLIIPNTITHIGSGSFAFNNLETLVIPDSVVYIGSGAFRINNLTEVTLGSNLREIHSTAFQSNLLTEIYIPNSVDFIGVRAFTTNTLDTVELPEHTEYSVSEDIQYSSFDLNTIITTR